MTNADTIKQNTPPPHQPFCNHTNNYSRNQTYSCQPLKAQGLIGGYPVLYCWTHGVMNNLKHTSASCTRLPENHKKDTTYDDRKGV